MRRTRSLALVSLLLVASCVQAPARHFGPAPAFELPDLAGGNLSLGSLRGKVVVLDFWATWCGPCIEELPRYSDFWQKNQARGVEVIGVVFDSGEPEDVRYFVREHKVPYRQLLGTGDVQEAYNATQGFPTTFVIDRQGVIKMKALGNPPDKFEALQTAVDAALGIP